MIELLSRDVKSLINPIPRLSPNERPLTILTLESTPVRPNRQCHACANAVYRAADTDLL